MKINEAVGNILRNTSDISADIDSINVSTNKVTVSPVRYYKTASPFRWSYSASTFSTESAQMNYKYTMLCTEISISGLGMFVPTTYIYSGSSNLQQKLRTLINQLAEVNNIIGTLPVDTRRWIVWNGSHCRLVVPMLFWNGVIKFYWAKIDDAATLSDLKAMVVGDIFYDSSYDTFTITSSRYLGEVLLCTTLNASVLQIASRVKLFSVESVSEPETITKYYISGGQSSPELNDRLLPEHSCYVNFQRLTGSDDFSVTHRHISATECVSLIETDYIIFPNGIEKE